MQTEFLNELYDLSKTESIYKTKSQDDDQPIRKALDNLSVFIDSVLGLKTEADEIYRQNKKIGFLYYTLPIWSYEGVEEGSWYLYFPSKFDSQATKTNYEKEIKNSLKGFSFSMFVSQEIKNIPSYIQINFEDEKTKSTDGDSKEKVVTFNENNSEEESLKIYFSAKIVKDKFIETLKDKIYLRDETSKEKTFGLLYDFLLKYSKTFNEIKKVYFISGNLLENKDGIENYGGLILALQEDITEEQRKLLSLAINLKYREIAVQDWADRENRRIRKEAIKSAKTAIMARNISHNLGSHVLYYLRQYLNGDIMVLAKVLENLKIEEKEGGQVAISFTNEDTQHTSIAKNKFELPFLRGLGSFLTYLQERQDFIAAIATDSIPAYTTVNFKDFVIDNFLKDKKAKRHNTSAKKDTREEKNILLEYIAQSEGATVDITFNGYKIDEEPLSKKDENLYNTLIDLPGGVLGRQAIYSIVENIIRNAAKHGIKSHDKKKELILDISVEKDENYYKINITDNLICNDKTIELLNTFIVEDLIDNDTNKLIDNHKGIKEILISALWLRGINITEVSKEDRLKYLKFTKTEDDNLQLQFKVLASKTLLIIEDNMPEEPVGNSEVEIKPSKTQVYQCIDFPTFEADKEEYFRYNLVLDNTAGEKIKKYKNSFRRLLFGKDISEEEKTQLNNPDKALYIKLFKQFLKERLGYSPDTKFAINIDISSSSNDRSIENIKDEDLKKLYKKSPDEKKINFGDDIYFEPVDCESIQISPKTIAFKRHIHDNANDLFKKDNEVQFDLNNNKRDTLDILEEIQNQFVSIESVTGNNSSFGMLVNSEIDDEWTLSQIEAAYSKILIIDERLFDTYTTQPTKAKANEKNKEVLELLKKWFEIGDEVTAENMRLHERGDDFLSIFSYLDDYNKNKRAEDLENMESDASKVIYELKQIGIYISEVEFKIISSFKEEEKALTNLLPKQTSGEFKTAFLLSIKNIEIATKKNDKLVDIWGNTIGSFSKGEIELNEAKTFHLVYAPHELHLAQPQFAA